ncbi:MAG TPA: glycosyltransferase family 4 protein [Candidatus Kapabacteria bacterium]|nr:glycosyltransferase family 4 protein [Candidatus Kapabacteria bacterium]
MKILQLAPRFPFPLDDGGKIGVANIFINLSRLGCEVHLFAFEDVKISQSAHDEAKQYGKVIIYPHIPKNSLFGAFLAFITNSSLYLNKHYSAKVREYLFSLCERERYDAIHCDHTAMASLGIELSRKFGIPVALRLHNIEFMIWQRYAENLSDTNPKKLFVSQQAKALKKAEIEIMSAVDACFAITEDEAALARQLSPKANILCVPIGVDCEKFKYADMSNRESKTLAIATTYKWQPNVDGLIWFIENVMPKLKKELSGVKLNLYGKGLPDKLRNYAHLGVCPIGYVEDIVPCLQKATLYVAPLFVGAGVRVKILEAMATGLPVVATDIAAQGISAGKSQGIIRANSANETANAIIALLKNRQMLSILGKSAADYIRANYNWQKNVKVILDEYQRLIQAKRPNLS